MSYLLDYQFRGVIMMIVALLGIVVYIFIMLLPIKIAKGRNVPDSEIQTIKLLSYVSIIIPILWFVAIILACTKSGNK